MKEPYFASLRCRHCRSVDVSIFELIAQCSVVNWSAVGPFTLLLKIGTEGLIQLAKMTRRKFDTQHQVAS
jgi:hypothetical protein